MLIVCCVIHCLLISYLQVLKMELEQLTEAGSSQAEVRAAGEQALEKATAKMEKLADIYRTRKEEFTEADGEPRVGGGGVAYSFVARPRDLTMLFRQRGGGYPNENHCICMPEMEGVWKRREGGRTHLILSPW